MHASGVACTDCHDPHAARLRAEGNGVCRTCHQPATYDTAAHHHHRPGTDAARCVACHMPSRLYMVVDRRHDHGFRVPRPDLSVSLGTPNACTDCHRDRPAAWVSEAVAKWYGPTRARGPSWAPALAAGRRREAGAGALLAAVAAEPAPAIVRATAVDLLARSPAAARPDLVERALHDPDPLVRRAGLGLLLGIEPPKRWDIGVPLLADPVRTVRLEAVNALAGVPVPAAELATFDRAVEEYRAAQALNADAYALGLDATGERAKALSVLADAQRRFTGEREILEALVQLSLAAGDADASARWAQKLRDLDGGAR